MKAIIKYNTKFSYLTYAVDKEPEQYIKESLRRGWDTMRIYHELAKIAKRHKLKMVNRRTVYTWVSKYNGS